MSGESIYNVIQEGPVETTGPYTGKYQKHFKERAKPVYSTFYEKGKEYDGSHARYFKQRDAVFGPIVNDTVDPKNFLRAGGGVKHQVPPVRERKIFTKPALDHAASNFRKGGGKGSLVPLDPLSGDQGVEKPPYGRRELGDDNGPNREGYGAPTGDGYGGIEGDEGGLDGTGNMGQEGRVGPNDSLNPLRKGIDGGDGNGLMDANGDNMGDVLQSSKNTGEYTGRGPLDGKKDFVRSNIIQMSNMVTKRRKDQPEYPTCRKTFGQEPPYLRRVKKEIDDEKMRLKSIEEARTQHHIQQMKRYVHRLDEKERLELLEKLRAKLNEKSTELIKMPFVKDTYTQVMRRAELEKGIKELESSIAKLDKDAVFVYNDDPRYVHWTKDAALEEATRFAADKSN